MPLSDAGAAGPDQQAAAILGVESVGQADGDVLTRHPATGHRRGILPRAYRNMARWSRYHGPGLTGRVERFARGLLVAGRGYPQARVHRGSS